MSDGNGQKPQIQEGVSEDMELPEEDGFDLGRLRLSQDFHNLAGVKKALMTIPVRRPDRQDFVRVRSGEGWYLETVVLEDSVDRETYLVDPLLRSELVGEVIPKVLYTTINRQGILFLWPIRLPGEDGRLNDWSKSALEAAEMAKTRWIRLIANRALGAYDVYNPVGNLPEPEWPGVSFQEVIRIAFRDKLISRMDHPVLRRLRGAT